MEHSSPRKRLRQSIQLQNYQSEAHIVPLPIHSQSSAPRVPFLGPEGISLSQQLPGGSANSTIGSHADRGMEPERKLEHQSRLLHPPDSRAPKWEDEPMPSSTPIARTSSSSGISQRLPTPRSEPRTHAFVEESPQRALVKDNEFDDVIASSCPPRTRESTESWISPAVSVTNRESYHVVSFKHVMREAVEHHSHVLCGLDLDVARAFLDPDILSAGAVYLFTRLYRRKHDQWLQDRGLVEKYAADMPSGADVSRAISELVHHDLFSSVGATSHASDYEKARELLWTLSSTEMREVFKMVPGARATKSTPRKVILPVLHELLRSPPESLQVRRPAGLWQVEDKKQTQTQLTPQRCTQGHLLSQVFSPGRSQVYSQAAEKKIQGTLTSIPPATRIAKKILSKVGNFVRIPSDVISALERIHFVVLLEEHAHASPSLVLSFTGQLRFPSYSRVHKTRVFPSREALNAYLKARDLERELEEAVDPKVKDWAKARELGSDAEFEVRNYLYPPVGAESAWSNCEPSFDSAVGATSQISREEIRQQLEHPFFRRYTSHWVHVRAAWHSVAALENLGEYETAVKRLELLLETKLLPKRRGKILDRLTINLSKHLKQQEKAMKHIVNALDGSADFLLHIGDRLELAKRAAKIHRDMHLPTTEAMLPSHLTGAKNRKETARNIVAQSLPSPLRRTLELLKRDIRTQYFKRIPVPEIPETPKKRSRAVRDRLQTTFTKDEERTGKGVSGKVGARVLYNSLGRSGVVHVEDLALQWYRGKGDWQGCHDEGGAFRFIFSLLLWECALFAAVPDVFQTPFQNSPMDLHSEAFYLTRKEAIDARIADIESMSVEHMEETLMSLYDNYEEIECVGCNWKGFRKEDLACIAGGLGGECLARIIKLLATDYNYWSGGLCDLILWKREDESPKVMLVEVKSARDKLSARQQAWISELTDMGVLCEVFKVVEQATDANEAQLSEAELTCVELSKLTSLE